MARRMLKFAAVGCAGIVLTFALLIAGGIGLNLRTPPDTDLSRSVLLDDPPAPLNSPIDIKVATYNVWGLWGLSSHRPERMEAIGRRLAELDVDVAGFQEAFVEGDRTILARALAEAGLTHRHYFRSGLVGSGLFVVSRWPIEEVFFRRFKDGGYWHKFQHGDWYAGKGVGVARIALPEGGVLDLFNTHVHADYGEPMYEPVKMSNIEDILGFIDAAACETSLVLSLGDFNVKDPEPQYIRLTGVGRLERVMGIPSRIDHIFQWPRSRYAVEVLDTVEFDETFVLDGKPVRFSDHPGYLSTLRIIPIQ